VIAWLKQLVEQARIRDAEVDVNAKCPSCGHRDGKLKCTVVSSDKGRTVMVEHTCNVCEAKFFEPTIVKPSAWVSAELLADSPQETQ
jgi:transcription elongation factor Elf1